MHILLQDMSRLRPMSRRRRLQQGQQKNRTDLLRDDEMVKEKGVCLNGHTSFFRLKTANFVVLSI